MKRARAGALTLTRVVDELLWVLRREGFAVATSQAIDAARAIAAVGLGEREIVREAVAAIVVQRAIERVRFDRVFDEFFGVGGAHARRSRSDFWERLADRGFAAVELDELRELFTSLAADGGGDLAALAQGGAELDRLLSLAGVGRTLSAMQNPLQAGFFTHRVLERVGVPRARAALALVRARLRDALGARGDLLADALAEELEASAETARAHVRAVLARRAEDDAARAAAGARRAADTAFTSLSDAEMDEVRRAVRAFAERLRGGARVRARRARRGRIDPHRTLRLALATGGVPFVAARRARRRDRPRLLLLCDVSDSVRTAATFMLELVAVAHELFDRTRSFVFVSDLGETTRLFHDLPVARALGEAFGGGVIPVSHNSNYGRVLRAFERTHLRDVDRRTTVVVLGDGRTNYQDEALDVLRAVRERARALVWLCPEPRATWGTGDSAMARYEREATVTLEVRCARELKDAARLLVSLRG